jgi:hypothetical protein
VLSEPPQALTHQRPRSLQAPDTSGGRPAPDTSGGRHAPARRPRARCRDDRPVFLDPSGRRWQRLRSSLALATAISWVLVVGYIIAIW